MRALSDCMTKAVMLTEFGRTLEKNGVKESIEL